MVLPKRESLPNSTSLRLLKFLQPNTSPHRSRVSQETQDLAMVGRAYSSHSGKAEPGPQTHHAFKLLSWNLASSDMPNCSRGSLPVIFRISFL